MNKILFAADPNAADLWDDALAGVATVERAYTLNEAMDLIVTGAFGLVITGTYFDGSQMFEFLRRLKADPVTRSIPVICARLISAPTSTEVAASPPMVANLAVAESACRALGAADFWDFALRQKKLGLASAKIEFAALARQHLESGQRV